MPSKKKDNGEKTEMNIEEWENGVCKMANTIIVVIEGFEEDQSRSGFSKTMCMYGCIYIYVCVCVCVYIYKEHIISFQTFFV